ncbi:DHHC zinc finger domain-containing protein [Balamuthia mandrillaris]
MQAPPHGPESRRNDNQYTKNLAAVFGADPPLTRAGALLEAAAPSEDESLLAEQGSTSASDNARYRRYLQERKKNQKFTLILFGRFELLSWTPEQGMRWLGLLFVACVSFIFINGFLSVWALVLAPWRMFESVWKLLALVLAHALYLITLWSYYKVIRSSPGYVPADWQPPWNNEEDEDSVELGRDKRKEEEGRENDPWRTMLCSKCNSLRPARAHHCSTCNRCVLAMDHHCPWVNNCVGQNNVKLFFLFLFYGTLLTMLGVLLFGLRILFLYFEKSEANPSQGILSMVFWDWKVIFLLFNFAILFGASSMLLSMLIHQVTLFCKNMTTLEMLAFQRKKIASRRNPSLYPNLKNEYNMGLKNNLRYFLGKDVRLWLIPTAPEFDALSAPKPSL